uniref:Amino acid permease/ SLC12A domain-containing protein n=1 Tax=Graphocephala atropunctata TaxID=36148 RepID=A0A1B6LT43_9HEMI
MATKRKHSVCSGDGKEGLPVAEEPLLGGTSQSKPAPERLNLKRELNLYSAVSLIITVMIGGGIFVSPSSALQRAGSVGEALVVWVVCGVLSLLGALTFAELSTVVPQSGAEYSFFRAAYSPLHKFWGPLPSFSFVWVVVLILRPAEAAIIILVFAEYVYQPVANTFDLQLCPLYQDYIKKIIALMALGLTTYINTRSVKLFVKMQNIFSSCKILVCVIVIAGGIYNLSKGIWGQNPWTSKIHHSGRSSSVNIQLFHGQPVWSCQVNICGWTRGPHARSSLLHSHPQVHACSGCCAPGYADIRVYFVWKHRHSYRICQLSHLVLLRVGIHGSPCPQENKTRCSETIQGTDRNPYPSSSAGCVVCSSSHCDGSISRTHWCCAVHHLGLLRLLRSGLQRLQTAVCWKIVLLSSSIDGSIATNRSTKVVN